MLKVIEQVNLLGEAIHAARERSPRQLVAIGGAPGAGKSTLAAELARRLRQQKCAAEVVALDGFHLDNRVLEARGLRNRKGSPESYDIAGFLHMVARLRSAEEDVVVPEFDRARDIAVAGSVVVPASCPVVIIEGNYLLFDETPWDALAPQWDVAARLEAPVADLRARMIHRWLTLGFSRTTATRRAERNDVPNARRVMEHSLPADFVL